MSPAEWNYNMNYEELFQELMPLEKELKDAKPRHKEAFLEERYNKV